MLSKPCVPPAAGEEAEEEEACREAVKLAHRLEGSSRHPFGQ